MKVVGVGCAECGNGEAGLGEGGGELGVGVDDGADLGELAIEQGVGVEIGGGAEIAFEDFAVEVGDDHVAGAEVIIGDAGGLDHNQSLLAINAGGVAEGVEDEAAADELEVGVKDLFAKGLKEHGHGSILLGARVARVRRV